MIFIHLTYTASCFLVVVTTSAVRSGADITDYFNYGFNEDTWAKYCEKQRRLRMDNNCNKIYVRPSVPRPLTPWPPLSHP